MGTRVRTRSFALALAAVVVAALVAVPGEASHGQPHATIKYWAVGANSVLRGFDPHETVEDIQGVTQHVATPSAPLTLVTSAENTGGGYCGPIYWNPVTNDFKTYQVTFGFQAAGDVNREAPVLTNGAATFSPGDSWFTVHGSTTHGIYANFKGSNNFRRYQSLPTATTLGIRVNQDTGNIFVAAFEDGLILELNPATNAVRRWTIGNRPYWLDIDDNGLVYTAAAAGGTFGDQIVRLNPATGEVQRWNVPAGSFQPSISFGMPNGVRVDPEGNLWFSRTPANAVGRLRVAANQIDDYAKPGMADPNGVAASGAGANLQAFFTERNTNRISLITAADAAPTVTSVTPAVSTVTPVSSTAVPVDLTIAPIRTTIPPQTFDSPGVDPSGILRFPAPPGVSGPAGISRVVAPGQIYGSFEGTDHLFGVDSSAIIAPPGGCPEGPTITLNITRPAAGTLYVNDVPSGPSGTASAVVRGSPLTVQATSSNPANTGPVQFLLDGLAQGTDPTSPYQLAMNTNVAPGPHVIKVRANQIDKPACAAEATALIVVQCFGVTLTLTRPVPGTIYSNDVPLGTTGGDAISLGGPLTASGDSSDPSKTLRVEYQMDGGTPLPDLLGNPYTATFDTTPLAPGLHVITGTLYELNPFCTSVVSINLRKPDPSVKGVAKGFYAAVNIPAEPQVHIGGASIGKSGGTDFIRIVDQPVPQITSVAHVVTDQSEGQLGATMYAQSDSLIHDVSLIGGLITADVLHARARAQYEVATNTGSVTDSGTEIVGLKINNTPVVSLGQPNTVVPLPGGMGQVVLQEEITSGAGAHAELTVNMIHVFLDTPSLKGEIIVASAFAGVNLGGDVFSGPETDLIHRIDDAGTDADAGGTQATAIPITPGTYSGSMTAGDNSDFYAFDTLQGERIVAVMKPAEREIVRINPIPPAPPTLTVPGITQYVLDTVGAITTVGPHQPDFDLFLYDPDGLLRAQGPGITLYPSSPERAELNADKPFTPPGVRGRWTLEVRRVNTVDGFYSLELQLPPVPLRDQNDAEIPGDASDGCGSARILPLPATHPAEIDDYVFPGVIRDADRSDFYSFDANIGQLVSVVMKPDELDDGADFDLYLYGPQAPGDRADCLSPILQSTLGGTPAKALPEAIVELPADVTGEYVLEVRRINAVANYYVQLNVTNPLPTIPNNDAMTGADAGDTCLTPTLVQPGVYEGRLPDTPDQDTEDWYSFNVNAQQDITAVMKPSELSNFDLELYGPACLPVPPDQYTVNHQILSVPETVHLTDAPAGAYRVRVHRVSGGGNYMLSILTSP